MAIFAVLADPGNTLLDSTVKFQFPDDHLTIRPGQYLLASSGTSKDVAKQLGLYEELSGPAVVVAVASYNGRAGLGVWEWIKTKWGVNGA